MSLVVAIKDKDTQTVYFGCDSLVLGNNTKVYNTNQSWSKIWGENTPNEEKLFLMGGVGFLRDIQLVQYSYGLTSGMCFELEKNGLTPETMSLAIAEDIFSILAEKKRISTDKNGDPISQIESKFIVAYGEDVYILHEDLSIEDTDDYLAIGSGEEVAKGVLEVTEGLSPVERINLAIQAASKIVPSVGGEIVILSTSSKINEEMKK